MCAIFVAKTFRVCLLYKKWTYSYSL